MSSWESILSASPEVRARWLGETSVAEIDQAVVGMGIEARRDAFASLSRAELGTLLGRVSPTALIALGRQGIAALGTYRAELVKTERVRGKMTEPQKLDIVVRTEPLAFRLTFQSGPSAGRRVLYNVDLRRNEVRIKEGGALGLVGALWLDLDNALTRVDTNHRATEIGFSPLLDLIEGDLKEAALKGVEHARSNEGFDEAGAYCSVFTAPPGVLSLYALSTRVGFDPLASLPTFVEVHDTEGHLETHRYARVQRADVPDDYFTLRAASL